MNEKILFIFEGKNPDQTIFECIKNAFASEFKDPDIVVCYETNIYILWKELSDDPDLDLINHLREKSEENRKALQGLLSSKIPQRFLFFDSDLHHGGKMSKKLSILSDALKFFNEETENGKLYISYPMAEALEDCCWDKSICFNVCVSPISLRRKYKKVVHKKNLFSGGHVRESITKEEFFYFIELNYEKACCLLNREDKIPQTIKEARNITQQEIFERQMRYFILKNQTVVILSAFPFFIIDFFNNETLSEQYNEMVKNFKPKESCGFSHILERISD